MKLSLQTFSSFGCGSGRACVIWHMAHVWPVLHVCGYVCTVCGYIHTIYGYVVLCVLLVLVLMDLCVET